MTDKVFYQAAAAEVANGVMDHALWIKVNAELPSANDIVRQAKYIQLRAEELATAARSRSISRFVPRTGWQWILYAGIAVVIAWIFGVVASFPSFSSVQSPEKPLKRTLGTVAPGCGNIFWSVAFFSVTSLSCLR